MPKITKYICDGCGKEKGETNHWFRGSKGNNYQGIKTTWISEWTLEDDNTGMYCGEACVLKAVSEWMQAQKDCAK